MSYYASPESHYFFRNDCVNDFVRRYVCDHNIISIYWLSLFFKCLLIPIHQQVITLKYLSFYLTHIFCAQLSLKKFSLAVAHNRVSSVHHVVLQYVHTALYMWIGDNRCSVLAEERLTTMDTVVGRIRVEKKFEKTRFSTNTRETGRRRYYSLLLSSTSGRDLHSVDENRNHVVRTSHTNTEIHDILQYPIDVLYFARQCICI